MRHRKCDIRLNNIALAHSAATVYTPEPIG
jgi:hypothetical protein